MLRPKKRLGIRLRRKEHSRQRGVGKGPGAGGNLPRRLRWLKCEDSIGQWEPDQWPYRPW